MTEPIDRKTSEQSAFVGFLNEENCLRFTLHNFLMGILLVVWGFLLASDLAETTD